MTSNLLRVVSGLAALVVVALCVASASACSTCGGGGATYGYAPATYSAGYAPSYSTAYYAPTTAYYAPAYTTAYAPAYTTAYYAPQTYTANYGGSSWWSGCCIGRLFGWGSQPTYAVSYAPTCTTCASPCTTCASPCSSCASPCSSCAQVTMRPVCDSCGSSCGCSDCGSGSCGSSCSGCSSCGGSAVVTQAGYQVSSGCSSCGQSAPATTTVVVPGNQTIVVPGTQQMVVPNTSGQPGMTSGSASPELAPNDQVQPRTFQKMMNDNGDLSPVPAPSTTPNGAMPNNGNAAPTNDATRTDSNANYFEAPKLFVPKDRTASRVAAPVHNALYEKPVNYRQVSTGPITAAQAQQDAAGWTSASH